MSPKRTELGKKVRRTALYVMIGGVAIADILLWWKFGVETDAHIKAGLFLWASFWATITATVISFEVISVVKYKQTISTFYTDWRLKNPFMSGLVLIILWVAFTALMVHLWWL